MQRQIARLAALAGHFQVRHAFARVPEVAHLELAQLLAPQRVEQQRRQDGAVALALDGVRLRRGQQLARLVVADRRRLAFAAFRLRPLDALDRVVGDSVLVAEILEQRGKRREPVPDRAVAVDSLAARVHALPHGVAPGDDVRPRHGAEFLRPRDAGEPHEIPDCVFVGAPGAGIGEIGEPLDLGRHVGELVELGGGQQPVGGSDCSRDLVGGHWRDRFRVTAAGSGNFARARRRAAAMFTWAVLRAQSRTD